MIKFKFYRRLLVFFGSKTFTKPNKDGSFSYCRVKGESTEINNILLSQGFTKEFIKK